VRFPVAGETPNLAAPGGDALTCQAIGYDWLKRVGHSAGLSSFDVPIAFADHPSNGSVPEVCAGVGNVTTTELMPQLSEVKANGVAFERLPSLSTATTVPL